MLLAKYDYDTDIAVQRKEAFNDGFSAGEERSITIGREEGRNEGISLGISLGITQAKLETAKSMKSENMSVDMIAHFTGLSVEEIEKLTLDKV